MIWSLPLTSVDTRHPMQCTHIHAGRTLIYIKLSFQKFLFGGQSCSSQIDLKPWGLFISKRRPGFLHTDVVSCLRALPDTCFSVPQGVTIGNVPPNQGCWPVLHGFFAHSQESQAAFMGENHHPKPQSQLQQKCLSLTSQTAYFDVHPYKGTVTIL